MRHLIAGLALGLSLAAVAPHGAAGEVYQWKDANGVTHYSESPPPSGTYQHRRITASGASTEQSASTDAAQAPAADANPQCATARRNIEALRGEGPVQQEDGDGNVRELNSDERANQLELAQASVRAYCTDGDSAS